MEKILQIPFALVVLRCEAGTTVDKKKKQKHKAISIHFSPQSWKSAYLRSYNASSTVSFVFWTCKGQPCFCIATNFFFLLAEQSHPYDLLICFTFIILQQSVLITRWCSFSPPLRLLSWMGERLTYCMFYSLTGAFPQSRPAFCRINSS